MAKKSNIDEFDEALLKKNVTRSDLFSMMSTLYRICIYQQMALESLRDPKNDNFDEEFASADEDLEQFYVDLNKLVGRETDEH
jgi:hypothetical protein